MESPERMAMTKYTLLRSAGITLIVGVMMGCASAPMQEMSDARQALQAARAAGAPMHAPVPYGNAEDQLSKAERELQGRKYKSARNDATNAKQAAVKARNMALSISQAKETVEQAEQIGALSDETRGLMTKAESAAAAGNEEDVATYSQQAKQEAQNDIKRFREQKLREDQENQQWLDKAKPLLDEAHQAEARLNPLQLEALRRAEETYQQKEGQRTYNIIQFVVADLHVPPAQPAAQPAASPPPPVESKPRTLEYQVLKGDNLWTIAAKQIVYGNALWWPLIYRSNQEEIANPDLLSPGQVLTVDLDPGDALVELAVRHSIKREGTPDQRKVLDQQFLREAK
jgi:nucleoid-associated protein YgaU